MELEINQDLEDICFENKIRMIVSGLVGPFLKNFAEQDTINRKLMKKLRKNKQKIMVLDGEVKRNAVKTVHTDDFNKKIDIMDREFTDSLERLKFELNTVRILVESNSLVAADLKTNVKHLGEKDKSIMEMVEANYKYIREFRDTIALESSRSIIASKAFIDSQTDCNHSFSEKINKLSFSISEINSKGIPELYTHIEKRNFEIEEIKSSVQSLQSDRVLTEHIVKLKNKLEGDISNFSEQISKETGELKFFLHKMLGLEISCEVSNTLLQVLDSRHIKKLIPVVETQLKEKDNAKKRYSIALDPVSANSLISKVKTQTKDLELNLASYKEKIIKEDEEIEKKIMEKKQKMLEKKKQRQFNLMLQAERQLKNNFDKSNKELSSERLLIENEDFNLSSARSTELQFIQTQIESIQKDIKNLERLKNDIVENKTMTNVLMTSLQEQLNRTKHEFRTSQIIFSEEIHQLLKQRGKESAELQKKCETLKASLAELENSLNFKQEVWNSTESSVNKLIECCKIVHKLIKQDEEDRKSLQLTGVNAQPKSKSPIKAKQSVSLKPECVSCTGQSSLLLTSFKLACLNYSPSDIEYNGKVYSRLGLISKIMRVIENSPSNENSQVIEAQSFDVITKRAKSASRVRFTRTVFESHFNKGPFSETPSKKSDLRSQKFNL